MKRSIVLLCGMVFVLTGVGCSTKCPDSLKTDVLDFAGGAFTAGLSADKAKLKTLSAKCDAFVEKNKGNDSCKFEEGGEFKLADYKKICSGLQKSIQ